MNATKPVVRFLFVPAFFLFCGFSLSDRVDEQREFAKGLERDIIKVDHSIRVTHELVDRSADNTYLPDVLFRLAELYVEKSRLVYYLQMETRGSDQAARSSEARFLKNEAIQVYSDLMRRFPGYRHNDGALFFVAHEFHELGMHDEMVKAYTELVDQYPRSRYMLESLYLLAEYHFNNDRLEEAGKAYRRILKLPESRMHDFARYKLGWIAVNRAIEDKRHWPRALALFERAAVSSSRDLGSRAIEGAVFCFTEVHPATSALDYFRKLTSSKTGYLNALEKLANRYFIKEQFDNAALVYRHIIELSYDVEKNLDYAQRIYDASALTRNKEKVDRDVQALAKATTRYLYSWRIPESRRNRLASEFEVFARDIVTQLHLLAQKRREKSVYRTTARAYRNYLQAFGFSAASDQIRSNYAESLFHSSQYLEAGRAYERIAREDPSARKEAMYSAIQSYQYALADHKDLSRAGKLETRQAIRQLGQEFVRANPGHEQTPAIRFNVARMLFEQGSWREAIEAFENYMDLHPDHVDVPVAGHLILDCLERMRDYRAMAKKGRSLLSRAAIRNNEFKKEVAARVERAETREADTEVLSANRAGRDPVQALLDLTGEQSQEQTEPLLRRAFDLACEQRDYKHAFESGARLADRFPRSSFLTRVYTTLANLSVQTTDFEQAANLNEDFHKRFPQAPAARMALGKAARIRAMLGQHERASRNYRILARTGEDRERGLALIEAARHHAAAGDWQAALQASRQAGDLLPDSIDAWLLQAEALVHKGDRESAKQAFLEASGAGGTSGAFRSAKALLRLGELLVEEAAGVRAGAGSKGSVQRKIEKVETAERVLTEVIGTRDPIWTVAALYGLNRLYLDLSGFLAKVRLPQSTPGEREILLQALAKQAAAQRDKAGSFREACLEIVRKKNVFGPYALACVEDRPEISARATRRRPERRTDGERIQRIQARLQKNPADTGSLCQLARASIRAGDFTLARLQLASVLERDERHVSAQNLTGVVSMHLEEDQLAYEAFSFAIDEDPDCLSARLNLAALEFKYRNTSAARQLLAKAKPDLRSVDLSSPDIHPLVGHMLRQLRLR